MKQAVLILSIVTASGVAHAAPKFSELCEHDSSLGREEAVRRQDLRDRTTLCELVEVKPAAGAAKVAAREPGWCDKVPADALEDAYLPAITSRMNGLVDGGYWWSSSSEIAGSLCISPGDATVKQQAAYFYQWWVNLTGLTPEQLDGLFRYFWDLPGKSIDAYEAGQKKMCAAFPAASDEASDRDRDLAAATRVSLGCGSGGVPYWVDRVPTDDLDWHLDAVAAPPSELIRSFAVLRCLGQPETIDDRELAAYAVCGTDARALDTKALEKEIAEYHELAKAHARLQMAAARKVAARYEEAAQAKAAKDEDWKKLLYDAPAAAWKAWKASVAANQDAFDAARSYEERFHGSSRKAAKGCWDEAWKHLKAHLAKAKPAPKSPLDARRALTDLVGTIILEHVTSCAEAEGQELVASYFGQLLEGARPARGPRYAAFHAVIDALAEIKADRPKLGVDLAWFGFLFREGSPIARGSSNLTSLDLAREDEGGVIKSVKKDGDGVRVEFKKAKWKTAAWNCTPTNRILRIDGGGSPVYDQDCVYAGEKWVEQTHSPVWIPKALAGGIKAGRFMRVASGVDRQDDAWVSIPVEVWSSKDRKTLVAYMGLELPS